MITKILNRLGFIPRAPSEQRFHDLASVFANQQMKIKQMEEYAARLHNIIIAADVQAIMMKNGSSLVNAKPSKLIVVMENGVRLENVTGGTLLINPAVSEMTLKGCTFDMFIAAPPMYERILKSLEKEPAP